MGVTAEQIETAVAAAGLVPRGFVRLAEDERGGPLHAMRSLALVGFAGRRGWDAFVRAPEAQDSLPDPLDRWSKRQIDALAAQLGAAAIYPFGGAPFWPFQRWAQRAEPLAPSPLGLLIHPEYGLWHSYRGALAFAEELHAPPPVQAPSPCASCQDHPCLSACPVAAFSGDRYAVQTCADWLRSDAGADCMIQGCKARMACPVGAGHAHQSDQASFGMRAFLAARD